MADTIITIGGETRQLERDIQAALSKNFQLTGFNSKSFTQPLGKIKGQLGEFEKSLEASNARVVAFGASAGSIYILTDAFKSMVKATIDVEKTLADINTVINASEKDIKTFGNTIFDVANKTSQSFETAAEAALEFSRQGLGLQETAKRTADALTLAKLSGLSAASSVEALTAAVNSYSEAGLNTTQVVNKLAAVDAKYAVSSADLAEAIKRVGSSASEAGVNIDQLVALVTSAQQTTSRGGAVIGNSFKTIFTRLQRPKVLDDLRDLGIQTTNAYGETLPLIQILSQLAKTFNTLGSAQKSQVAELVGGVYQINILKAVLGDLSKGYSTYSGALKTSSSATNEAEQRIGKLGETLDSQINRVTNNLKRAGSIVGELTIAPALEKVLSNVNTVLETFALGKEPQSLGEKAATGFLKGLGSFISGPGLLLGATAAFQIFRRLAVFVGDAGKTVLGLGQAAQQQAQIQAQILQILQKNPQLYAQIESGAVSVQSAAQGYLAIVNATNAALERQKNLAGQIAIAAGPNAPIVMGNVGAARPTKSSGKKTRAGGYIPQDVQAQEKMGAKMGGYKAGNIIKAPSSVGGVMNTAETVKYVPGFAQPFINPPKNSKAGVEHRKNAQKLTGVNPYNSNGFVPNFVDKKKQISINREMGRLFEEKVGADIGVAPSWNEAVDFKKVLKVPADISKQYNKNIYDSNVFADAHSGLGHDNATTIGKVIRHLDLSYKKIALSNNNDDFFIDSGGNIILIPDFVEIIGKGNDKEEFFSSKVSSLKADSKSLFLQGLTKKEQEQISKQKISLEFFKDKVNVDYTSKETPAASGPSKKQTKQKLPKKYKSNGFVPNFAYVKSMVARVVPNAFKPLTDTKGTAFKNTNIGRAKQKNFNTSNLTDEQVLSQAELNYPNLIMSVLGNNAFIPDINAVDKQSAGAQVYSAANKVSSFGATTANKPGQYNPFGGGAYKGNPELIGTGSVQGKAIKLSYANVGKLGRRWENSKDPAVKNAWANLQKYSKMKLIYKARMSYGGEEGTAQLNENSRGWYADDIDKELRKNSEILKTEYNNYLKSINRVGTYVDIKGSAEADLFGKDVNYMALRPDVLSRQMQGLPKFDWKTAADGIFYGDYKNNKAQYDRLAELMGKKWNYVADKKRMFLQSGGFIPNFAAGDGSISLEEYMTMKYGEQKPLTSLGGAALNAAYGKGVSLEEIKKKVGAVNPKYLNWSPGGATTALRETQKENRIQAQKEFTRKYGYRKIILPWEKTLADFGGDAKKFGQAYEDLVKQKFGGKRVDRFKSANEYGAYGANPITPMFNTTAVDFINPKSATDLSLGGTLIEARGGDKKNYNPSDITKKFDDFFNQNPSYDPKKWKRILVSRNAAGFIPNFASVFNKSKHIEMGGYFGQANKASAQGLNDLLNHIGIPVTPDKINKKDLTSLLSSKGNKLKLYNFIKQNPIQVGNYPDSYKEINDGNHRFTLAELAGIKNVPADYKNYFNGYVPNFNAVQEAMGREMSAGYSSSQVKVGKDNKLKTSFNPMGLGVYNSTEGSLGKGISLAEKAGINPKTKGMYAKGYIPNFAPQFNVSNILTGGVGNLKQNKDLINKINQNLSRLATDLTLSIPEIKRLKAETQQYADKLAKNTKQQSARFATDNLLTQATKELVVARKKASASQQQPPTIPTAPPPTIPPTVGAENKTSGGFNKTLLTTMAISQALSQAEAFGLINPESTTGKALTKGSELLNLGLTAKDLYSEYAPGIGKAIGGTKIGQKFVGSALGRTLAASAGRSGLVSAFGGIGAGVLGPLALAYGAGKAGSEAIDYFGGGENKFLPSFLQGGSFGTKQINKEQENVIKDLERYKTESGKAISAYSSAASSKYGFGNEDFGKLRSQAVQGIVGDLGGMQNASKFLKEYGGNIGTGKGSTNEFTEKLISNLKGLGKETGGLEFNKEKYQDLQKRVGSLNEEESKLLETYKKSKDVAAGLITEVNKFEKIKSISEIFNKTSSAMTTLTAKATMMLTIYRDLENREEERGKSLKKNLLGGVEAFNEPNKSAEANMNIFKSLRILNDPRLARNQMERGRAAQQYLTATTEMGVNLPKETRERLTKIIELGLKQFQGQNIMSLVRAGGAFRDTFGLGQGMLEGNLGTSVFAKTAGYKSAQEFQIGQNEQLMAAGALPSVQAKLMPFLGNEKTLQTFAQTERKIKEAELELNRLAQGAATGRVPMSEYQNVSKLIQAASEQVNLKSPEAAQKRALEAIDQAFSQLSEQSKIIAKFGDLFTARNDINLNGQVEVGLTKDAVEYLTVAKRQFDLNNKDKNKTGPELPVEAQRMEDLQTKGRMRQ